MPNLRFKGLHVLCELERLRLISSARTPLVMHARIVTTDGGECEGTLVPARVDNLAGIPIETKDGEKTIPWASLWELEHDYRDNLSFPDWNREVEAALN